MCGIAGIVNPKGIQTDQLRIMSETLRHRGPDDEGFLLAQEQRIRPCRGDDTIAFHQELPHLETQATAQFSVGLLHRRLSILDLSPQGHQPLLSADRKLALVFNGEIYNYRELRKELEVRGRNFTTQTDTEVILQGYAEWGLGVAERMRGMWAFALLDLEQQQLILSRDRFGIKPLYYAQQGQELAFASEIKALLKLEQVSATVESQSMIEFLSFGTLSQPFANLFAEIEELPPAHHLIVDLQQQQQGKLQQYYKIEEAWQQHKGAVRENPVEAYQHALEQSVNLHLRSDVPVGSCLSGGLDSSAIVSMAAPQLEGTLHTFTAAYKDADIDESNYAKMVSDRFSNIQAHYNFPTAQSFLDQVDELIYHQDLPIGSTSIFAQWEVMKAAHEQGIKVLLDGQGADEVLGGYYNFAGIHVLEAARAWRFGKALRAYKALQRNFTPNMKNATARAAYYFLPESLQRKYRAKERLGMHLVHPDYQQQVAQVVIPKRGGKTFRAHSLLSLKFGMYELLRYEDRNSMAFSIESRVPFLDHSVVEVGLALRNDDKIANGWTKHALRKSIETTLPEEVVWRKDKKGFVTPQQRWKNEVFPSIVDYIQSAEIPELFDKATILELCKSDLSNNAHLSEFWRMFSVLKWIERFEVNIR